MNCESLETNGRFDLGCGVGEESRLQNGFRLQHCCCNLAIMEVVATSGMQREEVVTFLEDKRIASEIIDLMLTKCAALHVANVKETVQPNWHFLEERLGISKRKLPMVVARCPQLLVVSICGRLEPMTLCLEGIGARRQDLATMVARFPHVLLHSVEEKLCPLLALLQSMGVKHQNLAKVIVRCPRLLSYSIEQKVRPTVAYLQKLGLEMKDVGRVLTNCPNILGYSVHNRLQPTVEFLQGIGIENEDLKRVATFFPNILCRRAETSFKPMVDHLLNIGFSSQQVAIIAAGYPPILTKSIRNSLQPKVDFLVHVMGRQLTEAVEYPAFFGSNLHRVIEPRHKKLQEHISSCSLSEMLDCNRTKFNRKFGIAE